MKRLIVGALLATMGLMAVDYTTYSVEELAAMRGSIPAEDQTAFSEALQSKLSELSPEERQAIMSKAKAGRKAKEALQTRTQARSRARSKAMEAISTGVSGGGRGAGSAGGGMGSGMGGGMGGMGGGMGGGGGMGR